MSISDKQDRIKIVVDMETKEGNQIVKNMLDNLSKEDEQEETNLFSQDFSSIIQEK